MPPLDKLIAGQYRRPAGIAGRLAGRRMAQQHRPENAWTVALLEPQPDDRILEIGFGPGIAIEALARVVTHGLVAGIDFSATMVALASERNAQALRDGRVDLRYGSVDALPFPDNHFDKAFGIHTLYFWPAPLEALAELHRVLKPGGKLVLTILPKERWRTEDGAPDPGSEICIPYTGDEVMGMLRSARFRDAHVQADPHPDHASNFSVLGIK